LRIWEERAARSTRQKGGTGAAHEKEKQQQHRLKRYREQRWRRRNSLSIYFPLLCCLSL